MQRDEHRHNEHHPALQFQIFSPLFGIYKQHGALWHLYEVCPVECSVARAPAIGRVVEFDAL